MSRKWVLIVDDDLKIRNLFKEVLEEHGYATITCGDGHEAFEFVRTIAPDLVMLDLRMDRVSGGGFLDSLRKADSPVVRGIAVLIVSGYLGEEQGHIEGLNIVGRLAKPTDLSTLVERVQEIIGLG